MEKHKDYVRVAAAQLKIGDPALPDTEVGPLIRYAEVDRVHAWVSEALQAGTKVITGAEKLSDSTYACTVLYDPPRDARVSTHEIFGPVVNVYPYKDINDAIQWANSLPVAFQASIFTGSLDTALRAYSRLNASAAMVNDHTAFRVDWMPFAGLGESGYGIGGVPYTMHDMQVDKMLVIRSKEV